MVKSCIPDCNFQIFLIYLRNILDVLIFFRWFYNLNSIYIIFLKVLHKVS